jgi:hypothetical protein
MAQASPQMRTCTVRILEKKTSKDLKRNLQFVGTVYQGSKEEKRSGAKIDRHLSAISTEYKCVSTHGVLSQLCGWAARIGSAGSWHGS